MGFTQSQRSGKNELFFSSINEHMVFDLIKLFFLLLSIVLLNHLLLIAVIESFAPEANKFALTNQQKVKYFTNFSFKKDLKWIYLCPYNIKVAPNVSVPNYLVVSFQHTSLFTTSVWISATLMIR